MRKKFNGFRRCGSLPNRKRTAALLAAALGPALLLPMLGALSVPAGAASALSPFVISLAAVSPVELGGAACFLPAVEPVTTSLGVIGAVALALLVCQVNRIRGPDRYRRLSRAGWCGAVL